MVFSDNVPLDQEIALKGFAAERGLLVMGPDCGTAVVGGLGLGFANVVSPGPVGIVAASGTGCQQLLALLDHAGVGVTLGARGRRPRPVRRGARAGHPRGAAAAGRGPRGRADRPGLQAARPPRWPTRSGRTPRACRPRSSWRSSGRDSPTSPPPPRRSLRRLGHDVPTWPVIGSAGPPSGGRLLRGLFVGGTLAGEARLIATEALGADAGHTFVDFGDDAYTAGRAHPMIDPTLRLEHLDRAAADPETAVLLLDVVLGHGAEADPAALLAPAIAALRQPVVVAVVGTAADPQGRDRQVACAGRGRRRGAPVQRRRHPPRGRARGGAAMNTPPAVVNTGADLLADAIADQAVPVTRVDWRPPMAGHRGRPRDRGRRPAPARGQRAGARCRARRDRHRWSTWRRRPSCSAWSAAQFLHAGPPIAWDRASGPLRGALMGGAALEGLVDDPEDAVALFESGTGVSLEPCHHRSTVGPMAGVVTPEHVAVRARGRGHRPAYVLLAQRGARQGAPVRRLRPRRADPAALDGRRARPAAAARGPLSRPAVRSTSPGSSPRCCRWATRPTTATGPAR